MKKMLALPAIAAAMGLMLSGCASTDAGGDAAPGELKIDVPDIPMVTELGENEGQVNIVAWSGFVEPAWTDTFTEETGCVVNRRVAGTSDEMVTLMRTGEYDLVSASGDASLRLIVGGDVQPINQKLIPNFGDDIVEGMQGQVYDTLNGKSYGVPIGRGANILQYNPDIVTEAPTSWDVAGGARSPDAGQLAAAVDLLKQQNKIIGDYWADPVKQITAFNGGDVVVGTSWEILRKLSENPKLEGTLPEEGSTGWSDAWMVGAKSKNVNCAYAWMDYTSSPEVNGAIAMNFGMAPANAAFCETSDEAREHCETFNATDEEYFKKVWFWTTPIEQCIDGRTDVKCTNFQQWTDAWVTVKG